MTLTFSPAGEEDILPIFQLNKDLIDRYEDTASIDYSYVLGWVRKNIESQLPRFRRVIADGHHAGYFSLSPDGEKWELDSLFILPGYQNQGIGTEIIKHCLHESGGKLFLYVFKENAGALRLYQRMGFRIVKDVRKTAYIMEYEKQGC